MSLEEKIEDLRKVVEPYISGDSKQKGEIFDHFLERIRRITGFLFEPIIDDMIESAVEEYFAVEIIESIEEIDYYMDELEKDLDIITDTELARKLYHNAVPIEGGKLVLNFRLLNNDSEEE